MTTRQKQSVIESSDAALDALAEALLPRLLPRLREALAAALDDEARLMTARDTPSPRATMEACRRGLIRGARRVHRKWTFSVAAWREYAEANGQRPAEKAAPSVDEDAEPSMDEEALEAMRRNLGFVAKPGSAR